MGLNKRTYSCHAILLTCIWLMGGYNVLFAQGVKNCGPVPVSQSTVVEVTRKPATATQTQFSYFQDWSNINGLTFREDGEASLHVPSFKIGQKLTLSNWGFTLPKGSVVEEITIMLEGRSEGEGCVHEIEVSLTGSSGENLGMNLANKANSKNAWSMNGNRKWTYGGKISKWGISANEDLVNSPHFGIAFQLSNNLNDGPFTAVINDISIKIKYREPYRVCNKDMAQFFQPAHSSHTSYFWNIPPGFRLMSANQKSNFLHIKNVNASPGIHEVCIDIKDKYGKETRCCTPFVLDACNPLSIGDFVWVDQNANGLQDEGEPGIGNVKIELFSNSGNLIQSTLSNSLGYYSFQNITPGQYYIRSELPAGFSFTSPLEPDNEKNSVITESHGAGTSDVISLQYESILNMDIGLTEIVSIGGLAWEDVDGNCVFDEGEPVLSGITVILYSSKSKISETTTDSDGRYLFDHLTVGVYSVEFFPGEGFFPIDKKEAIDGKISSSINQKNRTEWICPMEGGAVPDLNAGFFRKATIGDFVWHDVNRNGLQDEGETGISNLKILLLNEAGIKTDSTFTDVNGEYFLKTKPGKYRLSVDIAEGYTPTAFMAGTDTLADSNGQLSEGQVVSNEFSLFSGSERLDLDFGFVTLPGAITGTTWYDSNFNGLLDDHEPLREGIIVQLLDSNGNDLDSTLTDGNGEFIFENLEPGNYRLRFNNPDSDFFTILNETSDLGSKVNDEGLSSSITVLPNINSEGWNAGYVIPAVIGDYIWLDVNRNGIQDGDEEGINGVTVILFDTMGVEYLRTTSAEHPEDSTGGYYIFPAVFPGSYYIEFFPLEDLVPTIIVDSLPGQNSAIVTTETPFITGVFTLLPGEANLDMDAGFMLPGSDVQGVVWDDLNGDGIRQTNEQGIEGITVRLVEEGGSILEMNTTDADGQYSFISVDSGTYFVEIELPDTFIITVSGLDNVFTLENGSARSPDIQLPAGIVLSDIDAGLLGVRDITGTLWFDINNNGILDDSENGINDIKVTLFDITGAVIDSVLTAQLDGVSGSYVFNNVPFGEYYLGFELDEKYVITQPLVGDDVRVHSRLTNDFGDFTTSFIRIPEDGIFIVNGGVLALASISGLAWMDVNGNGIREENEPFMSGLRVRLFNNLHEVKAETITEMNGSYQFESLLPGMYYVSFEPGDGLIATLPNQGDDPTSDSDITAENGPFTTDFIELKGEDIQNIDGGFIEEESKIAGIVWMDSNGNGIFDEEEEGVNGVTVILFTANRIEVNRTETSTINGIEGSYEFNDPTPNSYYLFFDIDPSFLFTIPKVGDDETIDSDVTDQNGFNTTYTFEFPEDNTRNLNAGLVRLNALSGRIWIDGDEDGIRQDEDSGLNNVLVLLRDHTGLEIGRTTTMTIGDVEGAYQFSTVPNGMYFIEFRPGSDFEATIPNAGDDPFRDSDVTNENGPFTTGLFILDRDTMGIDGGLIPIQSQVDATDISSKFLQQEKNGKDLPLNMITGTEIFPGKELKDSYTDIRGKLEFSSNMDGDQPEGYELFRVELWSTDDEFIQGTIVDDSRELSLIGVMPGSYYLKLIAMPNWKLEEKIVMISGEENEVHQHWWIRKIEASAFVSVSDGMNLRVFPNVIIDRTRVDIGNVAGPIWLEVFDMSGNRLKRDQYWETNSSIEIDFSGNSAGQYIIRATDGKSVSVARIIKVD